MAEDQVPDLEPLPMDDDEEQQELPVFEIDEPIQIADTPAAPAGSKIQAFGAGAAKRAGAPRVEFKRPVNLTGTGATRCKFFHARLGPGPLEYMEKQINEWLDEEEIEVKYSTQVIGVLEGKHTEPNMFVIVWY